MTSTKSVLILSGFPSHTNLNNSLFNSFSISNGLGIVINRWVNIERIRVLMTVIFPTGVKYLYFQEFMVFLLFQLHFDNLKLASSLGHLKTLSPIN